MSAVDSRSFAAIAFSAKNAWPRARHDRANSGGRRKSAFVTGPPNTRFSAHIAERFTFIGNCQLLRVVCKASQFSAQFTCARGEQDRFFATAERAAEKLAQARAIK